MSKEFVNKDTNGFPRSLTGIEERRIVTNRCYDAATLHNWQATETRVASRNSDNFDRAKCVVHATMAAYAIDPMELSAQDELVFLMEASLAADKVLPCLFSNDKRKCNELWSQICLACPALQGKLFRSIGPQATES